LITILRVRSVRKHPQRSPALALFQGNLPHNLIGRALLFKTGSEEFNSDILSWAYQSHFITDNLWNRWILEDAIMKMPEDQRLDLLPVYPLTPTRRLLPDIKKALAHGQYRVLPLLSSMDAVEGSQVCTEWVQENIVKPGNSSLFVASSGILAKSSSASHFTELINRFWPQLTSAQQQRVITKLAAHVSNEGKSANEVFQWTMSSIKSGKLKLTCATVALLGRFLSMPTLRAQTLEIISERAGDIEGSHAELLFHFTDEPDSVERARALAEKVKYKNTQLVLEIIHHVAEHNIVGAEEIAKPFLSTGDSLLRKGVIVLLVRHGSVMGKRMIEDTFTGKSPRKTLYLSSSSYGRGNSAGDIYRTLSTHDYKETGKTWPPSYLHGSPSLEEIAGWKKFINSYPWFPGTDDAFYRLAFSQFAQRNYPECLATIRDYLNHDYWADDDARPYLYHLLRNVALSSDLSDNEMPYLPHLRNILSHPLAGLEGDEANLDSVINSLDWFLANPKYIEVLNTDRQTIKLMRDIAKLMKGAPADSVWRLIAANLEGNASSTEDRAEPSRSDDIERDEEDADEKADAIADLCFTDAEPGDEVTNIYKTDIVASVLYGVFHNFPSPPPAASKIDIPADAGEEAIRRTADYLNSRFSGVSVDAVNDHSMDEIITLALLHTGPDFEKWKEEFKPTINFLSALNTRNIPRVVAKKHLELLKGRGK